jgi:hypothetical protein
MNVVIEFENEYGEEIKGILVDSHYSEAFGCFMLLLSTENGPLITIRSDGIGIQSYVIEDDPAVVMVSGDSDDDEEDSDDS